jgi:hypothetical protein
VSDKLCGVVSGHFSHKAVAVEFDGPFAAGKPSGYLLIGLSPDYQPQYLPLSFGQRHSAASVENEGIFEKFIRRGGLIRTCLQAVCEDLAFVFQ